MTARKYTVHHTVLMSEDGRLWLEQRDLVFFDKGEAVEFAKQASIEVGGSFYRAYTVIDTLPSSHNPAMVAFLDEIETVCRKHDFSIACAEYDDQLGIVKFNERDMEILRGALDEVTE